MTMSTVFSMGGRYKRRTGETRDRPVPPLRMPIPRAERTRDRTDSIRGPGSTAKPRPAVHRAAERDSAAATRVFHLSLAACNLYLVAMDIIFLRDLRIDTVIGIYDWERRVTQTISLDLEMAT